MRPNFDAYYDREEADIIERFNRGDITRDEMNLEMRALRRSMRDEYEEDRERAARDVDDAWGRR